MKKHILTESELIEIASAVASTETDREAAEKLGMSGSLFCKRIKNSGYRIEITRKLVKINR